MRFKFVFYLRCHELGHWPGAFISIGLPKALIILIGAKICFFLWFQINVHNFVCGSGNMRFTTFAILEDCYYVIYLPRGKRARAAVRPPMLQKARLHSRTCSPPKLINNFRKR